MFKVDLVLGLNMANLISVKGRVLGYPEARAGQILDPKASREKDKRRVLIREAVD